MRRLFTAAASLQSKRQSRRWSDGPVAAIECLEDRSLLSASALATCAQVTKCQPKLSCSPGGGGSNCGQQPAWAQSSCTTRVVWCGGSKGDSSCQPPSCNQELAKVWGELCRIGFWNSCGDHQQCGDGNSCSSKPTCDGGGKSGSCDGQSTEWTGNCRPASSPCDSGNSCGDSGHDSNCHPSGCGQQAA